jgi:hypothetical protein
MAWWYDRSELTRSLEEARKLIKQEADSIEETKKRFPLSKKMHLSIFHVYNPKENDGLMQLLHIENRLRNLEKLEKMMWFGIVPTSFRCGHVMKAFSFNAYDFEAGPNFFSADDIKEAANDLWDMHGVIYNCFCCRQCCGFIRDLHIRYRAYRHLDLVALLPRLIPALYPIVRSYLVPPIHGVAIQSN